MAVQQLQNRRTRAVQLAVRRSPEAESANASTALYYSNKTISTYPRLRVEFGMRKENDDAFPTLSII
jgi:hypothetical protein